MGLGLPWVWLGLLLVWLVLVLVLFGLVLVVLGLALHSCGAHIYIYIYINSNLYVSNCAFKFYLYWCGLLLCVMSDSLCNCAFKFYLYWCGLLLCVMSDSWCDLVFFTKHVPLAELTLGVQYSKPGCSCRNEACAKLTYVYTPRSRGSRSSRKITNCATRFALVNDSAYD